ncbi:MAG TPA: class I SAM-dependent methyltransferase [Pirellulales bacterium]|nr:class I SAM-dependent methyltransferase [Pirellulales bacterium]
MIFCGRSDDFFGAFHAPGFFDLVFIDGWLEHEQVYRDVTNSLEVLTANGTIVLHDCNPTTEAMQRVPQDRVGGCFASMPA